MPHGAFGVVEIVAAVVAALVVGYLVMFGVLVAVSRFLNPD